MALRWPNKDPDATLDFELDWGAYLEGDAISSSTWIVPEGLTLEQQSFNDTVATVWLSGGVAGVGYVITNRITTAAGRADDRSVSLAVADR